MPLVIWGRGAGIRPSSVPPPFHCAFPCGLFLGVALGQPPRSPAAGCTTPFDCPLLLTAVDVEEAEEFEDMDEDELVRGIVFRGIKTPLTSSEFIEFRDWPPLIPHAGRLMLEKLGGLATAVMRNDGIESVAGERSLGRSGSRVGWDSEYHRCPLAAKSNLTPCTVCRRRYRRRLLQDAGSSARC